MTARSRILWSFAVTAVALFMVTLDNLVVTTALPVIRRDLHADLCRMTARHQHAHRRVLPAVHVR